MRESDIEKYLVQRAKAYGWEVRKVKWIGRRGAPDRVLMLDPNPFFGPDESIIWIELKAPGEKAEAHQLREHKRMRGMGQRVEVIDSWEGVDALLG